MQIEVIFCPACRNKLRITEDLLGTQVQCPQCRAMFLAPPPPPGTGPNDVGRASARIDTEPRPYSEPIEADELQGGAAASTGGWVNAAAIGLMIVSVLSLCASLLRILLAFSPDLLKQLMQNGPLARMAAMPGNIDPKFLFLTWGGLFSVASLVGFAGGWAMLRRRSYTLAVLGSIASIINFADCCCIGPNVLAGIAGLVVLFLPGVRDSFR